MRNMNIPLLVTLWAKQQGRCHYCRREMYGKSNPKSKEFPDLMSTEDHKIPRSQGGGRGDNIVLACRSCNFDKYILTEEEYLLIRLLRGDDALGPLADDVVQKTGRPKRKTRES